MHLREREKLKGTRQWADRERERLRRILPVCLVPFNFSLSLKCILSNCTRDSLSLSLSAYNTGHWLAERLWPLAS